VRASKPTFHPNAVISPAISLFLERLPPFLLQGSQVILPSSGSGLGAIRLTPFFPHLTLRFN